MFHYAKLAAAAFALFSVPGPALAQDESAERAMVAAVDSHQSATVDLLAQMVNINSGTMNHAGVRKVGAVVAREFEQLGFATEWVEAPGTDRAGHLVARHAGEGTGKRLLLIGHLDTVFEPDSPFQSWTREGNDGIGPGAGDDKGGIAVMLLALRAMKDAGTLESAAITAVLTGDEEDAGSPIADARAALLAAARDSDVALDFEGLVQENGRDMGSIARRSSGSFTVTVTGKTGHSSGVFSAPIGYGAIYEAARIVDDFRTHLRIGENGLTYNFGLVVGGEEAALDADGIRGTARGKTNIVSPTAILKGAMRARTQDQIDRTQAAMRAIVANNLPGTSAQIVFDEAYPPMPATAGNAALLARLNEVNRDLGLPEMEALDPLKRGAADISFVAHLVDGLNGLGPASSGGHAPGETVDIGSIPRQAKRAALLMTRLASDPRQP